MNIIVGCESSGAVRRALRALGHCAYSCDILNAEDGEKEFHLRGSIRSYLGDGWDMMIAFPPCTYLCNSGVRWLYYPDGKRDPQRWEAMYAGARLYADLWDAPIEKIALENPVQHRHAIQAIEAYKGVHLPAPHYIQPWQFGHGETKATGFRLKNLPPLKPTNIVEGRTPRVHHMSPGPDRGKERSRTLPGIAAAIAEQWGNL